MDLPEPTNGVQIGGPTTTLRKGHPTGKRHVAGTSNNKEETINQPFKSRRVVQSDNCTLSSATEGCASRADASAHTASPSIPANTARSCSVQDFESSKRQAKRKRASKKKIPAALGGKLVPTEAAKLKPPTHCEDCGAKKFDYEAKGLCCCSGDIKFALNEYPEELLHLYTVRDEDSLHFQKFSSIPRYLQLYFYNGQHEKENRLRLFPNLKEQIITLLMGLMDDSPYGKFFRSLKEIEVTEDTKIVLSTDLSHEQRVYNAPTSDEVTVVWLDSTTMQGNEGPHIIAYGRGLHSHRVKLFYGCYDPLQYPLLLPKGDIGWHQGLNKVSSSSFDGGLGASFPVSAVSGTESESLIEAEVANAARRRTRADKHISCREYYAYKFQIRPGNFILREDRLFQQYIVDMYVKIENTRLDFLRLNQEAIRADLYQGILDTLSLGENATCNVGKRIVLPPSFLGGPRDMSRRYLNAMALVQKYGKLDLFITITCNPNWPEIKSELAPGEQAQNRPYLVARIFHAKLTFLRKQLKEKQIFGEVAAMINVVEFQKCGLPHAHFLIILKPAYKVTQPEKFDDYVTVELPATDNPHLRSVVLRHMMHGPCGDSFPKCACMQIKDRKKECSKAYPKSFRNFTTNGSDSYPLYRRRDTGETVEVRKANMDNRSVVPYNPYLLAMFDCHLNVEVCSTIKAVKYLYKYVYKGHDRVLFNVVDGEVTPVVDEIEKYQSGRWVSPPEAAFRIFGFNLFDTTPPVQPVPKATSFEDLLTVKVTCCASFQEAALRRGILEEDNAAGKCMDEAMQVEMPNALRCLFATILIFGCPNNPAEFWCQYYDALSEDYRKQFPNEPEKILHKTAAQVEGFLEGMGKNFAHFNLAHLHVTDEPTIKVHEI
ncbi:uncharacterized protein LOC141617508 [Silene latifolia]|uniref:uncharacterized protein LOC141617508 n=1 Tax=Silene latifolia TaxID=37657 RepID=UPI003D772F4E